MMRSNLFYLGLLDMMLLLKLILSVGLFQNLMSCTNMSHDKILLHNLSLAGRTQRMVYSYSCSADDRKIHQVAFLEVHCSPHNPYRQRCFQLNILREEKTIS